MNIYTSYYGNIRKIKANVKIISISRFNPKWLTEGIHTCLSLAPPKEFVLSKNSRDKLSEEEFREYFYREVLMKLDPKEIEDYLISVADGHDIVLMCYEVPGESCHRHFVAEWLENALGYEVKEYLYA